MQKAIEEILKTKVTSEPELLKAKRKVAKKHGVKIMQNSVILGVYKKLLKSKKIKKDEKLERLLRKRAIRTMSGIAPVAVLTKPFKCPGKCAFCPTEKNVPQSYLSNEPAVMRAVRCGYNPYKQVSLRLRALEANGHEPTKIELIVIGGTWSVLPEKYKYWYIANLFAAANNYSKSEKRIKQSLKINELKKALLKEQQRNEKAKYKIVGLTLETRPDYINGEELWEMRKLGCTRVELGVQAIDNKILKLNKRGHGVKKIAEATKLLRDFGFKITYHFMPGLPGSNARKDFEMYKCIFTDARFQPDQIKFYPTVVTKGSLLYRWWKQGKYKAYSDKVLKSLIIKCKRITPRYVRIIRLIRDIPGESIIAGNKITNLRQIMKDKGVKCECIRCREARELSIINYQLSVKKYKTSSGDEYFISCESKDGKILYGFCRLNLSNENKILKNSAIVRELHVYGELAQSGKKTNVQHLGLGKKLMAEAERIAKKEKYQKMIVISGVGVRGYYKKLGYRLKDTYMIKELT